MPNMIPKHLRWQQAGLVILLVLLLAGTGIRIVFYAQDRPVWVDEAGLALNVIDKPWRAIVGSLDATVQVNPRASSLDEVGMRAKQTTPLAYLALLKISADAGGGAPRALRLPSLISSLLWLAGLAWWVRSRPCVEGLAIFAGIAFSRSVIDYSTEIKQYGLEAAVVFALQILILAHARPELWKKRQTFLVALAGAAAVWCAFGSVMVLAGNGLVMAIRAIRQRDRCSLVRLAGVFASWAGSFALYYFSLLHEKLALQSLSYQHAFPTPGFSIIRWMRDVLLGLFENPVGFDFRWAALGLFTAALGAITLWKRNRTEASLIMSPIAVTVAMAIAHLYPWSFQLVLFLSFSLSVLLGVGIAALVEYANTLQKYGWSIPIGLFTLAWSASAIAPILGIRSNNGFKYADVNALVSSIQDGHAPSRIFLTHANALVCRFYQKVYPRKWGEVGISTVSDGISGTHDVASLAQEITSFSAGRECWVVLSEGNWPPIQIELLTQLLNPLSLSEMRLLHGSIGLKLSPSPPQSRHIAPGNVSN